MDEFDYMVVDGETIPVPKGATDAELDEYEAEARIAIQNERAAKVVAGQQSTHMDKPVIVTPRAPGAGMVLEGGAPGEFFTVPRGTNRFTALGEQNKRNDIYKLSKNYDSLDALNIFAGEEASKLLMGVGNIFLNDDEDKKRNDTFMDTRNSLRYLDDEYPLQRFLGTMSPYVAGGLATGLGGEAAAGMAGFRSVAGGINSLRNISPGFFETVNASMNNPILRNAATGALTGAVDPFDTAISGALMSGGTAMAAGPIAELALARYQNFRPKPEREIIDWAKTKGFKVSAGKETGSEALQMQESAMGGFVNTVEIPQRIKMENSQNSNRIILNEMFGVPGKELDETAIRTADNFVKGEYDEIVNGITVNGAKVRRALNDNANFAKANITNVSELNKFKKMDVELRKIVGRGYLNGEKFQQYEQKLREAMSKVDEKSPLFEYYKNLKDDVEKSFIQGLPPDQLDKYKLAKNKYAALSLVKRHTRNGKVFWDDLSSEMNANAQARYGIYELPEGTPMNTLQKLTHFNMMNSRGSSLSAADEAAKKMKDFAGLRKYLFDLQMRGVNPKLRAPFSFGQGYNVVSSVGNADSENFRPVPSVMGYGKDLLTYIQENTQPAITTGIDGVLKMLGKDYDPNE